MPFPSFRCTAYNNESREWSDSGVQATLSDKRRSVCNEELGIAYFEAEVLTQTDYYPFGMMMPDRQWSASAEGYRYGFNGMERDDDTYGKGNALDFGARIYDSRLGRWLSVDAFESSFPSFSPFNFAINSPILFIDLDGNKFYNAHDIGSEYYRRVQSAIELVQKHNLELYNMLEHGKVHNNKLVLPGEPGYDSEDAVEINITIMISDIDQMTEAEEYDTYNTDFGRKPTNTSARSHLNGVTSNDEGMVFDGSKMKEIKGSSKYEIDYNQTDGINPLQIDVSRHDLDKGNIAVLQQGKPFIMPTKFTVKLDDYINTYSTLSTQDHERGIVFSHELGHIKGILLNLEAAYYFQMSRSKDEFKGGHSEGDPSGDQADKEENKHRRHATGKTE